MLEEKYIYIYCLKPIPMILFKNALIYDGAGSQPFKGDVLVDNDKIVKVEENIQPEAE